MHLLYFPLELVSQFKWFFVVKLLFLFFAVRFWHQYVFNHLSHLAQTDETTEPDNQITTPTGPSPTAEVPTPTLNNSTT